MRRMSGPRIAISAAILMLVVGGVGLIATLILNAFVLDAYDAFGEVSVPGSTSLQLPAGEMTVSFHTETTGQPGGGFPIPDLSLTISPPAGVAKPEVVENVGTTTSVNNDVHVRVWTVQIPQQGTYNIATDGNVNGYISPRLAFGHGSSVRLADLGVRWAAWFGRGGAGGWAVLVGPFGPQGQAARAGGAAELR